MTDIQWIKLSTDIFNNRKIRQIQNLPQGDTILVIWLKLLVLAGQINDSGLVYITPHIGYNTESLAAEMQRPAAMIQLAMDCFVQFGMAEVDERGIIFLPGWETYQNVDGMERIREQNRSRQKRYYDRKKALKESNVRPNVSITQPNAPEEEKEREREEEKEIHSLMHAREEEFDELSQERKYLGGALGQGVVLMSDAQMEDLLTKLSLEEFDKYVKAVAEQELKGRHYKGKTHYQAILDMAKKDRQLR